MVYEYLNYFVVLGTIIGAYHTYMQKSGRVDLIKVVVKLNGETYVFDTKYKVYEDIIIFISRAHDL